MLFDFNSLDHEYFMREALKEAEEAGLAGERPIGAVIVHDGQVIGRGHARHLGRTSKIAHAEMNALHQAEQYLCRNTHGNCVIYSTVEPCVMCLGAIVMADIDNVVFGLEDNWIKPSRMLAIDYVRRHIRNYIGGVLAEESARLWEHSSWNELSLLRDGIRSE